MKYEVSTLERFCSKVMQAAGLSAEEADIFSKSLLFADLRGIGSHGVTRLSTYSKRVSSGVIRSHVQPELLSDFGGAITVDGKDGVGAYVAMTVVDWCMERASKFGC